MKIRCPLWRTICGSNNGLKEHPSFGKRPIQHSFKLIYIAFLQIDLCPWISLMGTPMSIVIGKCTHIHPWFLLNINSEGFQWARISIWSRWKSVATHIFHWLKTIVHYGSFLVIFCGFSTPKLLKPFWGPKQRFLASNVSFLVIFQLFSGPKLPKPFWGPKRHFFGIKMNLMDNCFEPVE